MLSFEQPLASPVWELYLSSPGQKPGARAADLGGNYVRARSQMLSFEQPLASVEDLNIPQCVANGDEAIGIISEHHSRWVRQGATTEEMAAAP